MLCPFINAPLTLISNRSCITSVAVAGINSTALHGVLQVDPAALETLFSVLSGSSSSSIDEPTASVGNGAAATDAAATAAAGKASSMEGKPESATGGGVHAAPKSEAAKEASEKEPAPHSSAAGTSGAAETSKAAAAERAPVSGGGALPASESPQGPAVGISGGFLGITGDLTPAGA